MKVISMFNNKGGVGKTNILWNLSYELSKMNFKVLMIDFDPQCNLSLATMGESNFEQILSNQQTIRSYLQPLSQLTPGMHTHVHFPNYNSNRKLGLIAGDFWLNAYADSLNVGNDLLTGSGIAKFVSLRNLIQDSAESFENPDFVFIDLPPSFSTLVRSAMYSSDYYIVPCTSDTFSAYCLGLIGNMMPRFIQDWDTGLQRFKLNNNGSNAFDSYGQPKFCGWIFNGFDEQKVRNMPIRTIVQADQAHRDRIINAVNQLILNLNTNVTNYTPTYSPHTNDLEIGQVEDLNVLIQNSIIQSVPLSELRSVNQLAALQGRTGWASNQVDQIVRVSDKLEELARNVANL